jgi:hypothetical protein
VRRISEEGEAMTYTEEEAKTMACPMSMGHQDLTIKCYASKCMAWVWDDTIQRFKNGEIIPDRLGHCGMAKQ